MKPEDTMLTEINQSKIQIPYDSTYMRFLEYRKSEIESGTVG